MQIPAKVHPAIAHSGVDTATMAGTSCKQAPATLSRLAKGSPHRPLSKTRECSRASYETGDVVLEALKSDSSLRRVGRNRHRA